MAICIPIEKPSEYSSLIPAEIKIWFQVGTRNKRERRVNRSLHGSSFEHCDGQSSKLPGSAVSEKVLVCDGSPTLTTNDPD